MQAPVLGTRSQELWPGFMAGLLEIFGTPEGPEAGTDSLPVQCLVILKLCQRSQACLPTVAPWL